VVVLLGVLTILLRQAQGVGFVVRLLVMHPLVPLFVRQPTF
jgi:hypothetical protein